LIVEYQNILHNIFFQFDVTHDKHNSVLHVLTASAILVSCCFSTFTVEFDGWPMILTIGMGAMMDRTASRTAASLAVGDDMFVLQTSWLIVEWVGF
jgi:hypothetical protein